MPTATPDTVSSVTEVLRRAGHWFLHSGIQEPGGGVARYYLVKEGANRRTSTEITGYALSTYCFLYEYTGDPAYRDAAAHTADFLRGAWDDRLQLFPFEHPVSNNPDENRAYFFDSGIITRGLLYFHRLTGAAWTRDLGQACVHGMRRFENGGSYAPILQLPAADPLPYGSSWSNAPGCYQSKSALAWHAFSMPEFETALRRAMDNDDAFLPGTPERLRVMDRLHAYSYYLEALLAVAGRPECRTRLAAGIPRLAAFLRDIAPGFARSDVYAQLLRVRVLAAASGHVDLDRTAAAEEARAIPGFQYDSPDRRLNGGFCFGRRDGQLMPFANPVSTGFCLQALAFFHDYRTTGALRWDWQSLI